MYHEPAVEDIIRVAASLGVQLDSAQAEVYRRHTIEQLDALDTLLAVDRAEQHPPLLYPERDPGHAPEPDSDPYRAWKWRSDIGGEQDGLLSGKTVSFKDHVAVAKLPMTIGASGLSAFVPDFDATIVTRVLSAGGKVIGKNALSSITGEGPAPLNPHNIKHSPGGSSSGSGAAVAAREVDISFGGDQGGSIRIPAAHCGIVGLKPTFGLVSHMGATYLADPTIDHVGPMAVHTRDVALALQAVAGYDPFDARARSVAQQLDVMSSLEHGASGFRIGILQEGFGGADGAICDAVMAALEVLEKNGASLEKVSIPDHNFMNQAFLPIRTEGGRSLYDVGVASFGLETYYPSSLITALNEFLAENTALLAPGSLVRLIAASFSREAFRGATYAKAQNLRPALRRAYDEVLSEVDVLVMPTCKTLPEEIRPTPSDAIEALEAALATGRWPAALNTQPFNYTGHPALAVPCGKIDGLPTSMQFVGRFFDDARLLQLAQAYEDAVDWEYLTTPAVAL